MVQVTKPVGIVGHGWKGIEAPLVVAPKKGIKLGDSMPLPHTSSHESHDRTHECIVQLEHSQRERHTLSSRDA